MELHAHHRWQLAILFLAFLIWPLPGIAQINVEEERNLSAGQYVFSDELGGHKIISVSGIGSQKDPIIILQKMETLRPSTITVRNLKRYLHNDSSFSAWTSIHLQIVTHNISAASWIGYLFELQEELGKPSIYGDGLSFNQMTRNDKDFRSDRFLQHSVEFEPGDRLIFNDGWVNQREIVQFDLFVLDLSPTDVFYIVQVPQLPAS